jgi:cytochrome c oxidase subunit 2
MTRVAIFLGLTALLLTGGLQAVAEPQSALQPAGVQASHILDLWHLTMVVCTLVFVAVLAALSYALLRAPRANAETTADTGPLSRSEPKTRRYVLLAVAVSVILLFVLLIADITTDRALARLPLDGALHIRLTGHQWWWEARYDDKLSSRIFTTANELHIPVGQPVILSLHSADVIHSFWVPNLHGKKDLIPGRSATIKLRADEPGVYRGQCAEFCGYQHAKMALLIVAEPPAQYEAWAERQRQPASEPANAQQQRGRDLFMSSTCAMCHAVQGTIAQAVLGPSLTHVASRKYLGAGTLENNRGNLAAWILDPHRFKPGVNMPPHALKPDEIQALMSYLETLQ